MIDNKTAEDITIEKASMVLEVLLKHSEQDNSNLSFKEIMDEIIQKWRGN